ncbi:MAG: GDSL-type esterase/lipase family protein [Deltaproteobacteria bacterium]|nr:GDSL-type esterase/lipase family protein [Deltaproteobacteria bacterium]
MRSLTHLGCVLLVNSLLFHCAPMVDIDGGDDVSLGRDGRVSETGGDVAVSLGDALVGQDAVTGDLDADVTTQPDAQPGDVAGSRDAGASEAGPAPVLGQVLYPSDRAHSPMTESVRAALRAIARRGAGQSEQMFSKVGDSQTVYDSGYMVCFASGSVNLAGRDALRATIDHFRAGSVGGSDPYVRRSLAATVGWSASAPLQGSPSPIDRELDSARPRFTLIMFGSNDSQVRDLVRYGENLLDLADRAMARGAIPIFSSPPPRDDSAVADQWIPWYAHVARAVAQARQVPFVDVERALRAVPGHGLGGDNLHVNRSPRGACQFAPADMTYGQNVRNLLSLEALDRARMALSAAGTAPDATAASVRGAGTSTAPFVTTSLPFSDVRDTSTFGESLRARYDCSMANEGGREVHYQVVLARPTRVRAMVIDRGNVDVDLHLLNAADPSRCVARDDRTLVRDLPAGTHTFVVDTFVGGDGVARAGEFLFVAHAE